MEQIVAWLCCIIIISYVFKKIPATTIQIGITEDGVPAFMMSDQSVNQIHRITWNGVQLLTGKKWECVEFVRRYLILTKGIIFNDIEKAVELWSMSHFYDIAHKEYVPIKKYRIGATKLQRGDILVWAMGEDEPFGHVAVVTDSDGEHKVQIAEQNWDKWIAPHYSRTIHLLSQPRLLGFIRV